MNDTEVQRLRRLRSTVLRVRALAGALEPQPDRRQSVASRSAVACWLIARVVTGRLRAHPYLSYQRGPGGVRTAYDQLGARLAGAIARRRRLGLQTLSGELQRVLRELKDARALTWSPDLSDTFGRAQAQIERLINEVGAAARSKVGVHLRPDSQADADAGARVGHSGNLAAHGPYLTF